MAKTVTTNVEISGKLNSSLSAAIKSAQSQMTSLKGVTDQNATTLQAMQKHCNALKSSLSSMTAEYANYAAQGQESSAAAQELAEQIENTRSSLEAQESAIQSAVSAATNLANGYQNVGNSSKTLTDTISSQQSELDQLKAKYVEVATSQGKNSTEAQQLASQIKSLSSELASNKAKMSEASAEADSFDASLESAASAASNSESKFSALTVALGNLASAGFQKAIGAAKDFAKSVVETGSSYQDSMAEVAAISGTSIGSDEYNMMADAAREWGSKTKYSASEAADALKYMSLAGWDAEKSAAALPDVLNLAAASGMELGTASDIVTDYMSAFSNSAITTTQMVDMMSYAQSNSNTSTQQLADAYKNCAANMNASGQSIQTTTAMLEGLANQGAKGSEAGTQVAAMMRDITQKMDNGAIAIGDTSVAVMDSNGNFRDMLDIMTDVEAATQGMGDAEKAAALSATFTSDSMKGVNMLLNEQSKEYGNGIDAIKGYKAALDESTGAAQTAADTMSNTLTGKLASLSSAWDEVKISLFEGLQEPMMNAVDWITANVIPVVQNVVDKVVEFIPKIQEAFSKVSEFFGNMGISQGAGTAIAAIAGVATAGFGVSKVFGKIKSLNPFSNLGKTAKSGMSDAASAVSSGKSKIGSLFEGIGNGISTAFKGVGTAISSVLEGFNKMGLTGAGAFAISVAAITAALIALSACSDSVIPFLDNLSSIITSLVGGVLDGFANAIVTLSGVIPVLGTALANAAPFVEAIGTAIGNAAPGIEAFGTAVSTVIQGIATGVATIISAIAPYFDTLATMFTNLVAIVGEVVVGIIQALAPLLPDITAIVQAIAPVVQEIVVAFETVVSQISPIIDSISNLFEQLGDSIKTVCDGISEVIGSIGSAISGVLDSIAGIIDSIGNAALNAGTGFQNMAEGIATITELPLFDMAASLGAVATGAAQIGAASGGMATVGDAFQKLADALTMIAGSIDATVAAFTTLQSMASTISATITELQGNMSALSSVTLTVQSSMMTLGTSVSSAGAQVGVGAALIVAGFTQVSTGASAFMMAASIVLTATQQIATGFSSAQTSLTVFTALFAATAATVQATAASMASGVTSSVGSKIPAALTMAATSMTMLSTTATTTMTAISNTVRTNMTTAGNTVRTTVSQMVSTFTSGMNSMAASVTSALSGVASRIAGYMNAAVASVRNGIAQMQAACSVTIQGPNIRLPHISVSGSFSIDPPSAPSFSVSWYKKGGILDGATIFGSMGGSLLGGGEAGKEAVLPLSELWDNMERILKTAMLAASEPDTSLSNAGRLVNSGASITNDNSTGAVITFAPVINVSTTASSESSSVQTDIMSALQEAFPMFEDLLDDYFERKGVAALG